MDEGGHGAEMKNLREFQEVQQSDFKLAAELKQPDVSQISKLKEDMSPTKEDMLLLGQGMTGLN